MRTPSKAPKVKRSRPLYEMRIDFGGHGSMTAAPVTWPVLRKMVIDDLNNAKDPASVTLEVKRA